MANENGKRVLNRWGARLITPGEVNMIFGGLSSGPNFPHTNTACSLAVVAGSTDGDLNECGTT